MKRCHMSQCGAVAAISCETGKILDFEIMSKYCWNVRRTKLSIHNRNLKIGGRRTKIKMSVI